MSRRVEQKLHSNSVTLVGQFARVPVVEVEVASGLFQAIVVAHIFGLLIQFAFLPGHLVGLSGWSGLSFELVDPFRVEGVGGTGPVALA